jgi:hypothetical protein
MQFVSSAPFIQPSMPSTRASVDSQRQGGLYFPYFDHHAQNNLAYAYGALHQIFNQHTPYFNNMATKGMAFNPSDELARTMQQAKQLQRFPFELNYTLLAEAPEGMYVQLHHEASKDERTGHLKPDFAHVMSRLESKLAEFVALGLGPESPPVPFSLHPLDVEAKDLNLATDVKRFNYPEVELLHQKTKPPFFQAKNDKRPSLLSLDQYEVSEPVIGAKNNIVPFERNA